MNETAEEVKRYLAASDPLVPFAAEYQHIRQAAYALLKVIEELEAEIERLKAELAEDEAAIHNYETTGRMSGEIPF